jgi:TonB-dependent SusC/RagA subfamily outer membrane receptor
MRNPIVLSAFALSTVAPLASAQVTVVDSAKLVPGVATSPLELLAGKVAGLRVLTPSGQPGLAPHVVMRSGIPLGDSDPLIIVDGTPMRLSTADFASADVERIEIMRGPATASVYGADAANGVVIITLKRPPADSGGTMRVTAQARFGFNSRPRTPEIARHHPFQVNVAGTAFVLDSTGKRILDPDQLIDNPYPHFYDQFAAMMPGRATIGQDVQASQRWSSTGFYGSFTNLHDAGILRSLHGYERRTARVDLTQFLRNFEARLGGYFATSRSDNSDVHAHDPMQVNPGVPDTALTACDPHLAPPCPWSPMADLRLGNTASDRSRGRGLASLEWRPLSWLSAQASMSVDVEIQDDTLLETAPFSSSYWHYEHHEQNRVSTSQASITVTRPIFGDHIRTVSRLSYSNEAQQWRYDSLNTSGVGFTTVSASPRIHQLGAGLASTLVYRDRYSVTANVRRDRQTGVVRQEGAHVYHGVAVSATPELSLPGVRSYTFRIAHGTAGDYPHPLRSPFGAPVFFLGPPPVFAKGPSFSGETEYGVSLTFPRRVRAEYVYSTRRTIGTWYGDPMISTGNVHSQANELLLEAALVSSEQSALSVGITADRVRSKRFGMPNGAMRVQTTVGIGAITRYENGRPAVDILVADVIRTKAELDSAIAHSRVAGPASQYAVNEAGIYVMSLGTPDERRLLGDFRPLAVEPDLRFGLTTRARWRAFSARVTMDGVVGGMIYNQGRRYGIIEGLDPLVDGYGRLFNKPMAYYYSDALVPGVLLYESATYSRLKELDIEWTLPAALTRRLPGADDVRLAVSGRNLFTSTKYSGYDPDVAARGGNSTLVEFVDGPDTVVPRTISARLLVNF